MFSHLSERRCTKANFAPEKQKILLLFAEAACFQRECFLVSKPREQLWRTMFPRDVLKLTIGLGLRILTCQGCGSIKFLGLCFRSFLLFLKPIKAGAIRNEDKRNGLNHSIHGSQYITAHTT